MKEILGYVILLVPALFGVHWGIYCRRTNKTFQFAIGVTTFVTLFSIFIGQWLIHS